MTVTVTVTVTGSCVLRPEAGLLHAYCPGPCGRHDAVVEVAWLRLGRLGCLQLGYLLRG